MDFKTDDPRIKHALEISDKAKIDYKFKSVANASTFHPNTVKVETYDGKNASNVIGESIGGGVIRIKEINGFDCNFTASAHTLIVEAEDKPGSIAFISNVISRDECNIATMTVSRKGKNDIACQVIEMDSGIKPITLEYLKQLNWVRDALYIPDIEN